MSVLLLIVIPIMTAAGVWAAEKFGGRFGKGRQWRLGLWFGFLAIVANSASALSPSACNLTLSLRDIPVISAALFFGPVPGIMSGTIAAIESAIMAACGVGISTWCPMSTFLVALAGAATIKLFLDGVRPTLSQALILGVVFELLHLVCDVLIGLSWFAFCCESLFKVILLDVFAFVIAMGLDCMVLKHDRKAVPDSLFSPTRILCVFVLFVAIIVTENAYDAYKECRGRGENALQRLEYVFNSQIDFMLHQDAVWIAEKLGTLKKMSEEEVRKIIVDVLYDEMCIVNPEGKIISTNDKKFFAFDFAKCEETRKYLELCKDGSKYVSEPFRPSGLDGTMTKYGGVALPDCSGFIQLGYYYNRLEEDFIKFFSPALRNNIKLGTREYCLVASRDDEMIVCADAEHYAVEGSWLKDIGLDTDDSFVHLLGEWCHVRVKELGKWRVFCVVPISEIFRPAMVNCAIIILICLAFVFAFRIIMLRFKRQREKIDRLREEADERNRHELEMASKIQSSSLPTDFPSREQFSISAKMCPAKEVGGDFYDCYKHADGKIVLTVADVSGKGIPAAMFMFQAKQTLKASMFHAASLVDTFVESNRQLFMHNEVDMFVTVWSGIFDPATGVVDFVNAGHNPPIVKRADGTCEWVRKRGGLPLGVMQDASYSAGSITLAPGDSLLLYTDGVTEAQDEKENFYGEKRLEMLLKSCNREIVPEIVFDDVAVFAGGAEQADDITVLSLDVRALKGNKP